MKKLLILLFALTTVQLYGQTESPDNQPVEQTEQNTDQVEQTDQDPYGEQPTIDVPSENVQMAEPQDASSYQSSPGHSSGGNGTEVIRYYSGSHSGNNVTRKVEVPLPEGSATSRSY